MSVLLAFTILTLLITAAWRDVATRTIPDTVSLLLFAAGGLTRILEGPAAFLVSAAATLVLFVLLLALFVRGLIGGGDVKIMTALAIGLSPLDCYRFVLATAIAGGILAIIYLVLSRVLRVPQRTAGKSVFSRIKMIESWRIRRRGPLPYGVAIAVGGAFVLQWPGSF